jgi:hypothetical protein
MIVLDEVLVRRTAVTKLFLPNQHFWRGIHKDVILRSLMEQRALKNANDCLNTSIYSYLETSGGQNSNL